MFSHLCDDSMRFYENETQSSHSNPAVSPVSLNSRNVPHNFTSVFFVFLCCAGFEVMSFIMLQR